MLVSVLVLNGKQAKKYVGLSESEVSNHTERKLGHFQEKGDLDLK